MATSPPDATARCVLAALVSDPFLAEVITKRMRDRVIVVENGKERRIPRGES
jgi:hypothetical protein